MSLFVLCGGIICEDMWAERQMIYKINDWFCNNYSDDKKRERLNPVPLRASVYISHHANGKRCMSMITQPISKGKLHGIAKGLFFMFELGDLAKLYESLITAFAARQILKLIMPCCGTYCTPCDYTLYGHYTRQKGITDVTLTYSAGKPVWHIVNIEGFKIQRIRCLHEDGMYRTHALLFDMLVPYGHYTLRAILYYIMLFSQGKNTVVGFCARHCLDVETYYRWLNWIKTYGPDLMGIGNTSVTNKADLCLRFIDLLKNDFLSVYKHAAEQFRRVLFQTHATHRNSVRLYGISIIA